ncbi:ABC transporter substrate-binding protein [Rhizohabitans arisaemae]|uniref:ABC transporter substrate-binding protein n=1 Tax=Rhizohabitans arisaemae TaxID=2720610 RepID=UPI0024B07BA0|nr:ABC transporter substrate-binding protein [Rhizohabitans arisaemae]
MRFGLAFRGSLIGLVAALTLSACGSSGTDSGKPANAGGLEKTELTIGVVPVPSAAPLYIAMEKGFFDQEGIKIKTLPIQAPQAVMPQILNGSIDTFMSSYVSFLSINDSEQAKLRLLADAQAGKSGIHNIVVLKDSAIKEPKDLKGKTIAVNALKALGELTMSAQLQVHGLTPLDVDFVAVPFDQQIASLETGKVDAAWLVEPFLSGAQTKLGVRTIIDTIAGPTADLPLDGWAATEEWVTKHPKTAAAFTRALAKGQKIAAEDRNAINRIIPTYTKISAEAAAAMGMGVYSTSLSPQRVQRVADLMFRFQYLKRNVDVTKLLASSTG